MLSSIPGIYKPTTSNLGSLGQSMFRTLGPSSINSGNTTGNTGVPNAFAQIKLPNIGTPGLGNSYGPQAPPGFGSTLGPRVPTPPNAAAPYDQGPSSATAGGGATYTDANSSGANSVTNPLGTGFGYDPISPDVIDSTFLNKQLQGDQQLKADLSTIATKQHSYVDQLTSAAQAAEIAGGFGFDPNDAAKYGFKLPQTFNDAQGNQFDIGSALQNALSDPGVLANAQANPFSQAAQIKNSFGHLLNQQDASMVARGMARSGSYQDSSGNYIGGPGVSGPGGYQHQQAGYQDQLANYNAMQSFLGSLNSGVDTMTGKMNDSFDAVNTARTNALSRMLAMINAGALTLPSKNTPPPTQQNPLNNPATNPYVTPQAPPPPPLQSPYYFGGGQGTYSDANSSPTGSGYAPSPGVGAAGAAGAGGAASSVSGFLGGMFGGSPAAAPPAAAPTQAPQIPDWMTNNGWGSFGWGGGDPGTSGGDDGSSYAPVSIPDTGNALGDAQASWMANTPDPAAVYRKYGLSPDIGLWRT